MKKLLSIILIVAILPLVGVFTGCGDYNLKNLKTDFGSVVSDCKHVKYENDKFIINYSDFVNDDTAYMLEVISKDGPYKNINYMNTLLDNSMSFFYSYVGLCSSDKLNVSKDLKNAVKSDLSKLKNSFTKLDVLVAETANTVKFNYNQSFDKTSLKDLEKLLNQYVVVIKDSLALSKDVQNIYSSAIIGTGLDLNTVSLADFDTSRVLNQLDYIKKTSIADLTDVYVNSYLDSEKLLSSLITKQSGTYPQIDLNFNNYLSRTNELKTNIVLATAKAKADQNKQDFLQSSIEMFNSLKILNNDYIKYSAVKDKVNYAEARLDTENTKKNSYINIIKNYDAVVMNCSANIISVLNIIR